MQLDSDFLQLLVDKNEEDGVKVFVSDTRNTLIAATQINDLDSYLGFGTFILKNKTPLILETPNKEHLNIYGLPLFENEQIIGSIILEGEKKRVQEIGNKLKAEIEALCIYRNFEGRNKNLNSNEKQRENLINLLLNEELQEEKVLSLFNKLEIDPSLMHSVIYIRYTFEKVNYFNINLNLGYQSDVENTKIKMNELLRSVKYFNSQDIIGKIGQNSTAVIKSFIPTENMNDVYSANTKICKEIERKLKSISSLDFHIATGDVYHELSQIKKSYLEAKDILDIARHYHKEEKLLTLKSILLEDTYHYLDSHIKNKLIKTIFDQLQTAEPAHYEQLLAILDAYIECGFNISQTSQITGLHRNTVNNKLLHFETITGLDVTHNFAQAFLVKMVCIYHEQVKVKDLI